MRNFHAASILNRRRFLATAGTATGVGLALGSASTASAKHPAIPRTRPAPNPIPGGLELAPGVVIHVFPAGDPAVTLPFTGFTLGGIDVEPCTITDFKGSSAVAYHVGSARASDGRTYNLETDIRAYEGRYVVDGKTHHGAFALV